MTVQNPQSPSDIDSILDAAAMVVENGGSTALADRVLGNVAKGLGLEGLSAVWRVDCLLVSYPENGRTVTLMRPIDPAGLNLVRVSETAVLGEHLAHGSIERAAFLEEMAAVRTLPFPHGRWLMALAAACAGATFARTLAGDNGALVVCATAAGVGQILRSQLQAWKLRRASVTIICALLSALIATAGLRLSVSHSAPAALMGSVIYMMPGLMLINSFVDLTSERFLFAGLQQLMRAAFLFLLLTIAVAVADALL